ncbi:hypothetical protein ACS0TY_024879 [Phlomoides rotata]
MSRPPPTVREWEVRQVSPEARSSARSPTRVPRNQRVKRADSPPIVAVAEHEKEKDQDEEDHDEIPSLNVGRRVNMLQARGPEGLYVAFSLFPLNLIRKIRPSDEPSRASTSLYLPLSPPSLK